MDEQLIGPHMQTVFHIKAVSTVHIFGDRQFLTIQKDLRDGIQTIEDQLDAVFLHQFSVHIKITGEDIILLQIRQNFFFVFTIIRVLDHTRFQ